MVTATVKAPPNNTDVQSTFTPSVGIQGSKKLELQIELQETPAVIRSTAQQPQLVVRGHIVVICREVQRMHGQIKASFVGTKNLENIQQMGSVGSQKKVIAKQEKLLDLNTEGDGLYSVGTYRVPFEFVLKSSNLAPSISVPRCTVEYIVTATVDKKGSSYLKMLLPLVNGTAKAQCTVPVVRYPADSEGNDEQTDLLAHVGPITRVGTLGSGTSGTGKLPFRITMDRNVTTPGDMVGFALEVYPPGQTPDFTPVEFAALSRIAGASNDNSQNSSDLSDSASMASNADDQTIPISCPPTYQPTGTELAGNKLTVTAYKVRAKLVQRVCYMTDHDLVADADDSVYLFWTKRIMADAFVARSLDLSKAINGSGEKIKVEWVIAVPEQIQPDVHTPDIQVRYDVFVDFYPRFNGSASKSTSGALKGMVSRVNNRRLSSKLPLRTIPAPVSVPLGADPPSYSI
ncbi:hypothetical protein IW140_004214 [Coemansia sp. RSA 1813]|nr:hypothetical protein EV178_004315 [Coemansia sp. RSA 1646]KAJ1769483.1 hypothetical protein LPJ74_004031 [Coemansia sp. RSA 1843]KAJ2088066.1 hypothetical protein IW138_004486 [Coemansia sp. RSA 986]KAJ2214853.1 hypothetical protein EV179_002663 [Coemansia sp. RSA 487]KAJ2568043.1 hypothetical protein IW140_004214 [Coemansia sp. RSA 1813]